MTNPIRIVLDAMGSDNYPAPDVEGALQAVREYPDVHVILVGDRAIIEKELAKHGTTPPRMEIVHAPQIVSMEDKPSNVARAKPESSIAVGLGLVRDGKADAFVTAGNTGATLAYATLNTLRRIPGVKRPALATLVQVQGRTCVLVDIGANADTRPEWLLQFAIMSSLYAEKVLGTPRPSVALLSNGEEEGKGNELVHATAELLRTSDMQSQYNFIGNVEPKDVLNGAADVVVADGFVGNIAIKSMEAIGDYIFQTLRTEVKGNLLNLIGAMLLRPALRRLYHRLDPMEIGGAPLLGVNGVVIIGHGRSNPKGIKNAIGQARRAVQGGIVGAIREGMAKHSE
jgi:phosphate acyltransferase